MRALSVKRFVDGWCKTLSLRTYFCEHCPRFDFHEGVIGQTFWRRIMRGTYLQPFYCESVSYFDILDGLSVRAFLMWTLKVPVSIRALVIVKLLFCFFCRRVMRGTLRKDFYFEQCHEGIIRDVFYLWREALSVSFSFTYPLATGVVGAPQMTSQPVPSIFLCSPLPSRTWRILGVSFPWFCFWELHLFFFRLPCLLPHFTVPYKLVLARSDEQETCPYHFSSRFFTMVRRSSCGPIACWILAQTSWLVTWSSIRCIVSCDDVRT